MIIGLKEAQKRMRELSRGATIEDAKEIDELNQVNMKEAEEFANCCAQCADDPNGDLQDELDKLEADNVEEKLVDIVPAANDPFIEPEVNPEPAPEPAPAHEEEERKTEPEKAPVREPISYPDLEPLPPSPIMEYAPIPIAIATPEPPPQEEKCSVYCTATHRYG